MYSAVMKPALPLVVVSMPFCCSVMATDSAPPQQRPLVTRSFREVWGWGTPCFLRIRRSTAQRPSKKKKAMMARAALKVKGPTYSAPMLCATKAVPQIKAASTGSTF